MDGSMRPPRTLRAALVLALATSLEAQGAAPGSGDRTDALAPYLVGSSHPELTRPPATATELAHVRTRASNLLASPRRPGRDAVREFTGEIVAAVDKRHLLYVDAALVLTRVESALAGTGPDKATIRRILVDIETTLADTRLAGHDRQSLLRCIRELLATARNGLP